MQRAALGILLLLIRAAQQESGYSPYEDEEIEGELKYDFDCFSILTLKKNELNCNLTSQNRRGFRNVVMTACVSPMNSGCVTMERKKDMYMLTKIHGLQTFNICLSVQDKPTCKVYELKKIVLPHPPFNVTVTHDKLEKEYIISYKGASVGDYLSTNLIYQIALRKENEGWPDCEKHTKQCINTEYTDIQISETIFAPGKKYEVKVHSKPYGEFYKGRWSAWSKPIGFESQAIPQDAGGNILLLSTLITVAFLLLLLFSILISVFWKSRIKPFVWPEIPDHTSTLEHLCKKPKMDLHMSFNTDLFQDTNINKLDCIKAKLPTEDPSHQSTEDWVQKSEMGEDATTCNISSMPEKSIGDFSAGKNPDIQSCKQSDHMTDNVTKNNSILTTPVILTSNSLKPSNSYNCNPPNGLSSPRLAHPEMESALKQPNNECKALCREEAYITMSAFKTPSTSVK